MRQLIEGDRGSPNRCTPTKSRSDTLVLSDDVEQRELELLKELFARPNGLSQRVAPHEAPWGPWTSRPQPSQEYPAAPPALPASPNRWAGPDAFSPRKETLVNAFAPGFGDARATTSFFEPSHTAPYFVAPPTIVAFEPVPKNLCKPRTPRLGARKSNLDAPPPLEISSMWTQLSSSPTTASPSAATATTRRTDSGGRRRGRQRSRTCSYSEISGIHCTGREREHHSLTALSLSLTNIFASH